MGSYANCWLGTLHVDWSKNDINVAIMQLFQSSDKKVKNREELPSSPAPVWMNPMEEEDQPYTFYSAPVPIIRDRLELRGYTLQVATAEFMMSAKIRLIEYKELAQKETGKFYEQYIYQLETISFKKWFSTLKLIKDQKLKREDGGTGSKYEGTLIGYMLDHEWYGYPGTDLFVWLRLVLEACSDSEELIYDVTDLILSGYFDPEEDLVEYALTLLSTDYSAFGKTIVLTEGRSDGWIISESLQLLYPHLSNYFTFMDFEGARIGGGAGNLANMVKAFAGVGIINRMIALFDNDTAAKAAIQTLQKVHLPKNIIVMTLPDLSTLERYPTIGPSGSVVMDVNGIAASIELYLGEDVLLDDKGRLTPVQWSAYEASLRQYQGEVLFKDRIQERFKKRLDECKREQEVINKTDWAGIRAILLELFIAFHDIDAEEICSGEIIARK